MATLSILDNFTTTNNGVTASGKQGAFTSGFSDSYTISGLTGLTKQMASQLATATVITLYDDSVDTPTDFSYLHFIADQTAYLQLLTSATNFVMKLGALIPFSFGGFNSLLAAANATPITGGATPTTTDIKKIVLGNYSGTTMDYAFFVMA